MERGLITWEIFESDEKSCYKNISKILDVSLIFGKFEKNQNRKKIINKIYMDSEKLMYPFETKKDWLTVFRRTRNE